MSNSANFKAVEAYLGRPNFKVIDVNPNEIAKSLQGYLLRGSRLTGVSLDDIDCTVHTALPAGRNPTLVDLIEAGMLIFDGLVWLSADRPSTHPIVVDSTKTKDNCPTMHEIARSVFYVYFFLMTQARYPVADSNLQKPAVANFLKVVMGMTEDQSVYIKRVCSFTANKFDPSWVKFVSFSNFGQEALSRFGLGVAGYRNFGPFKLYTPRNGLSPEIMAAYRFARAVAMAPPTWDVHPLTRNPRILTTRGNLNKNLSNLILECFDEVQIAEMVKSKVLYKIPEREANYMNYKTWSEVDDISGTTNVFQGI